jgi:hypothetical protein
MRVRFAELTGAFVNLDPQGKVVVSVYSSGAIGRLVPDDVAGLVATSASTPGLGLRIGRAAGHRQSAAPVRDDDLDFPERIRLTPGDDTVPDQPAGLYRGD